jgi:curved DNA-binding protein CbpA
LASESQSRFQNRTSSGASADPEDEDHYSLLGVPFTATHAEITRAYRQTMKRAHPDRQRPERRAAAEALARRLNAAYATLSDPIKRQAYDRTIRQQVIQDQIMRRYVGGFQTVGDAAGPSPGFQRPEPTEAERRERLEANRQASLTLVLVAVGVTVFILAALFLSSLLAALVQALR